MIKTLFTPLACAIVLLMGCKEKPANSSSSMIVEASEPVKMVVKWISGRAWQDYKGQHKELRNGATIHEGSEVSVDSNSVVDLGMSDGSMLRLMEKTKLVVSKVLIEETKRNVELKMDKGAMYFKIMKNINTTENTVKFQTATATAAIRGTEGGISADEAGTKAYLREGVLFLKSSQGNDSTEITALEMAIQEQNKFVKSKAQSAQDADQKFKAATPSQNWKLDSLSQAGQKFDEMEQARQAADARIDANLRHNTTEQEYNEAEKDLGQVQPTNAPNVPAQKEQFNQELAKQQATVQNALESRQNAVSNELEKKQNAVTQAAEEGKAKINTVVEQKSTNIQQNQVKHEENVKSSLDKMEQSKQKSGIGAKSKSAYDELDGID